MSLSDSRTRAGLIIIVLLVCGAVGWSMFGSDSPPGPALTDAAEGQPGGPDLSVETLKKADPAETMKLFRRDDLTEEQREELGRNIREAHQERITERINRYFSAEGDQRTAVLDEQIDEFLEMRKRMEEAREQDPPDEDWRERMRQRWRNRPPPSRAERKEAFETNRAENRSRMMAYFQAVRARMQERGMEMPRGPGGHGGPGMRGGSPGGRPGGGDSGERRSRNR